MSSSENCSRHEMLEWVNSVVHGQYKKIEELCSGVAYCQMVELLFPNSIGLKKVKTAAKLEHEYLHNLKLIQVAFARNKIDKAVPIERLIKGRFQDNFEFLQWFKKFFDTHSAGKNNLKVPAALAAAAENAPRPIRKPPTPTSVVAEKNIGQGDQLHSVSPDTFRVLKETKEKYGDQINKLDHERIYYYKKLTDIEELLQNSVENGVQVDFCKRALALLYTTQEDDDTPGDASAEIADTSI